MSSAGGKAPEARAHVLSTKGCIQEEISRVAKEIVLHLFYFLSTKLQQCNF